MSWTCDCPVANGFTEVDSFWVHADCGKPTAAWFAELGDDMMNYFRGGPLDGKAYETSALLTPGASSLPLIDYRWTQEHVTSQLTGAEARVWVFKDDAQPAPVESPPPQEEPQVANTSNAYVARRKALKLTRNDVCVGTGLTWGQLTRLETDKSVKPDIVTTVDEWLREREQVQVPSQ